MALVGGRGLIAGARIKQELAGIEGLRRIAALKAPAVRAPAGEGVIRPSLFGATDPAETSSPDCPRERLIARYNTLLASERARTREELGRRGRAGQNRGGEQAGQAAPAGQGEEALRAGRVTDRFKAAKHLRLSITDHGFAWERDQKSIAQEAALDGICMIGTSLPARDSPPEEAARAYKDLSRAEQAFRRLKDGPS
ncbi:MAG: hypothetical protein H5T74_13200 [Actinobacteria bacterium]|nr:hypothetical protein [Actinomycetota bacterium]